MIDYISRTLVYRELVLNEATDRQPLSKANLSGPIK